MTWCFKLNDMAYKSKTKIKNASNLLKMSKDSTNSKIIWAINSNIIFYDEKISQWNEFCIKNI